MLLDNLFVQFFIDHQIKYTRKIKKIDIINDINIIITVHDG